MDSAQTLPAALPLADIQDLVRTDMAAVDALIRRRLASDVVLINQVAEYIIGAGGKRLRPMLLLLAARRGTASSTAVSRWRSSAPPGPMAFLSRCTASALLTERVLDFLHAR